MINLIAAVSKNGQIGFNNQMPWHLPEDLAYFKKITSHHTIIMGRKTFESIGRPLPNRRNIVLTRDIHYSHKGIEVVHCLDEALKLCLSLDNCFIIGGGEIYKAFLPYADYLYLTLIEEDFKGDTAFPYYKDQFECIKSTLPQCSSSLKYTFTLWQRTTKSGLLH